MQKKTFQFSHLFQKQPPRNNAYKGKASRLHRLRYFRPHFDERNRKKKGNKKAKRKERKSRHRKKHHLVTATRCCEAVFLILIEFMAKIVIIKFSITAAPVSSAFFPPSLFSHYLLSNRCSISLFRTTDDDGGGAASRSLKQLLKQFNCLIIFAARRLNYCQVKFQYSATYTKVINNKPES